VKTVTGTDESLLLRQTAVRARAGVGTGPADRPPAPAAAETAPRAAGAARANPAAPDRPADPAQRRTEGATVPPVPDVADAPVKPPVEALPPAPVLNLPEGSKDERMRWLRERVTRDPVCLARVRPGKKVVVGVGNLNARVFFCGEAPGAEEEVQGEPFVGPAGALLTRMIQAMGLPRGDVYIGNILNWRPELPTPPGAEQMGNRPPTPEEMTYCLPFLRAQLEIVAPEVIVALGSTAAQGLFGVGSFKTLGEIRGRWRTFGDKPVMVTYHPSYILRNGSNRSKRAIWEDLLQVMERLALPITDRQRGYFLDR
jgi:uracil-DNA glycosylase